MSSLIERWTAKTLRRIGYISKAEAEYIAADQRERQRMADEAKHGDANWRGGLTTMKQLRTLAVNCDVVANAVQLRIDQVRATPLQVLPVDGLDESEAQSEIEQAQEFLATTGGLGGPGVTWQEFICSGVYDLLTVGALAGYRRANKRGGMFAFELVDAATIKPLLTPGGWPPQPPDFAFEQYNLSSGQKVGQFTADELRYVRYNSALTSRFGRSPTENVLVAILQYLAYDAWNLSWATDGDADFSYWEVPSEWSVQQIEEFTAFINSLNAAMAGKQAMATKPIPAGPKRVKERPIKEASFEKTQVHLVRRIARAFGLNASVLGFEGAQYKVTQEGSEKQAVLWGADVTKLLLSDLLTDILQDDLGLTKVKAGWDEGGEDLSEVATWLNTVGTTLVPINEGREKLGLPGLEGPYVDAVFVMSQTGPVVLGWTPGTEPPPEEEPEPEAALVPPPPPPETPEEPLAQEPPPPAAKSLGETADRDLAKWRTKALKFLREGHLAKAVAFSSDSLPPSVVQSVAGRLAVAKSAEDVRAAFEVGDNGNGREGLTEEVAKSLLAAVREEQSARSV